MSRQVALAPPQKIAPRLLLTRFFPARSLALVKGAWPKERKKAYIRRTKQSCSLKGYPLRSGELFWYPGFCESMKGYIQTWARSNFFGGNSFLPSTPKKQFCSSPSLHSEKWRCKKSLHCSTPELLSLTHYPSIKMLYHTYLTSSKPFQTCSIFLKHIIQV